MTKGQIFLAPFPYDELSATKVRPVACLTNPIGTRRHVILAYITSQIAAELMETDIVLNASHPDFSASGLRVSSIIRLHEIATVCTLVIQRKLGELSSDLQDRISEKLCNLLTE